MRGADRERERERREWGGEGCKKSESNMREIKENTILMTKMCLRFWLVVINLPLTVKKRCGRGDER